MMLSLLVGRGLMVTRSATVETRRQLGTGWLADEVGRPDLAVTNQDTSLDLYIPIEEIPAIMLAADGGITAVHPHLEIGVDMEMPAEEEELAGATVPG